MHKDSAADGTNLQLEYGCGKAFTLPCAVLLCERDAEVANFVVVELVLAANSTVLPVLVIFWQFFLVTFVTLDIGLAVSAVFGLHIDRAKVWMCVMVPI